MRFGCRRFTRDDAPASLEQIVDAVKDWMLCGLTDDNAVRNTASPCIIGIGSGGVIKT
jgi:hypothetical protein